MKRVQISIPPFKTHEEARNVVQNAFASLISTLTQALSPKQLDAQGMEVVNLADPTTRFSAATKNYVDLGLEALALEGLQTLGTSSTTTTIVGGVLAGASSVSLAQTGNVVAPLQISGAIAPAGMYRVSVYANVATSGSGTCTPHVFWVDGGPLSSMSFGVLSLALSANTLQGSIVCCIQMEVQI